MSLRTPLHLRSGRKLAPRPEWPVRSAVRILRTEAELSEAVERAVQTERAAVARTQARLTRYSIRVEIDEARKSATQ
jgi:hypothetical protein